MNEPLPREPRRSEWAVYAIAVAFCLLLLIWSLKLWQADLRVPLVYFGEAKYNALLVKTVLDFGWHEHNPAMAAPDALDLRDVPMSDNNLHFALIKLIGLFTHRYGRALNLFFLLSFPLVTIAAVFVLRHFGVSRVVAVFAALIYAFLPYHFVRGEHHLFLAAYFTVPLSVMMILWVGAGAVSLVGASTGRFAVSPRNRKLIASIVICLVLSATGTYYAFFTCFFLLVAGLMAAFQFKNARYMLLPCVLAAIIFAGLAVNLLPSILYLRAQGSTPVVQRAPYEAEIYALRIGQLFLPVSGHRLFPMAALKAAFNQRVFINENDDATLGAIGSIGFLALLGWLLLRKPEHARIEEDGSQGVISRLSVLNFAGLLLGTFGGIGALFALLVTTKIRAYNRISIFLAFFSLMAAAMFLDRFARRRVNTRARQIAFVSVLAVGLVLGIMDQTTPAFVPEYAKIIREFNSDAKFCQQIQAAMPPGAMIFQLPIVPFPENPKVGKMYDYDHARGFLHSRGLRWSYGAMKGRESEIWQRQVTAKPTTEMLETVALSGFEGIYLNRNGYNEAPSKAETEIAAILGQPQFISDDGKLIFFDLRGYVNGLHQQITGDWERRSDDALHPLIALWAEGFSDQEGPPDNYHRWCKATGELKIVNGSARTRQAKLTMSFQTENDANLWISGSLLNEQLTTSTKPLPFERTIAIPPGRHSIFFRSDGRRVIAPGDFRTLILKVNNFKLTSE